MLRPLVKELSSCGYSSEVASGTRPSMIMRPSSSTGGWKLPRICARSFMTRPPFSSGTAMRTRSTGSSSFVPVRASPSMMPIGVATAKSSGWVCHT
ncbi:hypothetical protein D3C81_1312900 [compost metagenome]